MCDAERGPAFLDEDDISDAEFEAVAFHFVDQGLLELVVHDGELGFRITPRGRLAFDVPSQSAATSPASMTELEVIDPVRLT